MSDNQRMLKNDFDAYVRRKKKSKIKKTAAAVILVLAIAAVGFYICAEKLFFIQKLVIDDNTEKGAFVGEYPYTSEELLSGLGLKKGEGLYTFDEKAAYEKAKYNLPYISQIKLSRRPPSTLAVKTVLENPTYYTLVDNNLYILSDNLKVLEVTDNAEKLELFSLIFLECDKIHSCVVGEKLGIPEDIEKVVHEIREKLCENEVEREISGIEVSDKFNISMMYGTKYLIKLGDSKSLGTKIEFMKRIIEDRKQDAVGGMIDVSDEKNREAIYKKFG